MNAQIENIVVFPQSEQETAHKASLKEGYYQVANQIGLVLVQSFIKQSGKPIGSGDLV
ncbi:hypothetical protein [Vibrio penaeicida]|uniref:hypothetical protein n=1 Tax=Vibrio penaeicida TaxID=104609 RepID=UPI001CC3D3D4|nr:hypothetical protein [Vibrio penaeicida]